MFPAPLRYIFPPYPSFIPTRTRGEADIRVQLIQGESSLALSQTPIAKGSREREGDGGGDVGEGGRGGGEGGRGGRGRAEVVD